MTAVGTVDCKCRTPIASNSSAECNSCAECWPTIPSSSSAMPERPEFRRISSSCRPKSQHIRSTQRDPTRAWSRLRALLLICILLLQSSGGVLSLLFSSELAKRHAILRRSAITGNGQKLLMDFGEAKVVNFDKYDNVIALVLDDARFIAYNVLRDVTTDSPKLGEVWRRQLKAPLPAFHEFKLIDRRTLLFCTSQHCEACKLDKSEGEGCTYFSLSATNHTSFASVRASLIGENRLILRTVSANNTHSGSIFTLQPGGRRPVNQATDRTGIDDVAVVQAFTDERYTFFVGSASKIDVPYNMFTGDTARRRRMDLRVTRVCNQDATNRFESRIDVALSCAGLDDGDGYWNASPKRAKAAKLSEDNARLYILFENNTSTAYSSAEATPNDVICEFSMAQLMNRFEQTWDTCQNINDAAELTKMCKVGKDNMTTDPRCYIFAWSRNTRVPLCERFRTGDDNVADNCNLAASKISANRNFWLENYQPLMGRIVARFNNNDLKDVFEGNLREVIFVSRADSVERLRKANATSTLHTTLWSTLVTSSLSTAAAADDATDSLIFVDQNKLKYVHLTCQDMYPTCKLISWLDPLRCRWCADEKGNGHPFSINMPQSCPASDQSLDKCPPTITEAVYDRDRFLVLGEDFGNVEHIKVRACDKECSFDKASELVHCYANPNCPIELTGHVGSSKDFRLIYTNHLKEPAAGDFAHSFRNNSRLVRILVTIFVVFLLSVILVIVWQLYRKYANNLQRIRMKMQQNAEKTPKRKYMSVPNGGVPLIACHKHIHGHPITSITHPHMSFSGTATTTSASNSVSAGAFVFGGVNCADEFGGFSLCDDSESIVCGPNRIDKSKILLLKQIGDGNSSTVHLAKYMIDSDANVSRRVAVKTICNSAFDMEDVMREIELISRCRHKNIVEYIGHFGDAFSRMHIVTEYMAGGDLHKFLICSSNKLTVGDAFLFILQICEGMEYLTKQHIIHRDLAARNCMLDDANVVVKITDFGLCRTSNIDYEYISENAAQQLPFRWTAIECFGTNRKFSEKSDVWSFGVVVWEIFARDLTPYSGRDSNGVREFLNAGNRLEFEHIPSCPQEIYERILLPCWETLPQDRPTFTKLRGEIERSYWTLKNTSPEYLKTEYETPISSVGSPTQTLPSSPITMEPI